MLPISSPQGSFASTIPLGKRRRIAAAPASELFKGKTAYRRFHANINDRRKTHCVVADKLCFLRCHAFFCIDNDVQIARRLCCKAAARKLEATAASRAPRKDEVHPAVFEKV